MRTARRGILSFLLLFCGTTGCDAARGFYDRTSRTVDTVDDAGKQIYGLGRDLRSEIRRNEPRAQRLVDDVELLAEQTGNVAGALDEFGVEAKGAFNHAKSLLKQAQERLPSAEKLRGWGDDLISIANSYHSASLIETARIELMGNQPAPALIADVDERLDRQVECLREIVSNDAVTATGQAAALVAVEVDQRLKPLYAEIADWRTEVGRRAAALKDESARWQRTVDEIFDWLKSMLAVWLVVAIGAGIVALAQLLNAVKVLCAIVGAAFKPIYHIFRLVRWARPTTSK